MHLGTDQMDADIELNISFRFLALSEELVSEAKLSLKVSSCRPNKKLGGYVVCIPLTQSSLVSITSFVTSNNIKIENTDIFISFATEYDSRILKLPSLIAKASVYIGSPVTLSHTVV